VHSAQKPSHSLFLSVFSGIFRFVVSKAFPVQPSAQNAQETHALCVGIPAGPDFLARFL
jgi:hypothetical protein